MRYLSFEIAGRASYGLVEGDKVIDLGKQLGPEFPDFRSLVTAQKTGEAQRLSGSPADYSLQDLNLWIPVPNPGKIICVGVNYPDRNAEYQDGSQQPKYPSLFMRTPQSLVGHERPLMLPPESEQYDYEGEIVLIIGKSGRRIPQEQALDHVFGLTLANEGSVRDWLRHAKFNVTQGKNFDQSGAMGPWIVPVEEAGDLRELDFTTHVNGELRQQDVSGNMIFFFDYLLSYISTFSALHPGDIIVTGTPTGAGARFDPPKWLVPGDRVEVSCPALGTLGNTVQAETPAERSDRERFGEILDQIPNRTPILGDEL